MKGLLLKGARILRRKAIDSEKDPYLLKTSPDKIAECRRCGLVYHDKRWANLSEVPAIFAEKKRIKALCPACGKIKDRYPEGFVTLQGAFLKGHKDEILNLIRNKEERASRFNPLGRVIEIREREGAIEITTTTDKFAQRIGKIVKKAFNGEVEYKWSSDVKLARVVWTRE